jgi:hypothetical protein
MGVTVDVEIGATIPLGDYTNLKTRVSFNGLDPSQPIEPQLDQCAVIAMAAVKRIDEKTEEIIVNTASLAANQPGIADRLAELEKQMGKRRENEQKIAGKVKELLAQVPAAVAEAIPPADPPAPAKPAKGKAKDEGSPISEGA